MRIQTELLLFANPFQKKQQHGFRNVYNRRQDFSVSLPCPPCKRGPNIGQNHHKMPKVVRGGSSTGIAARINENNDYKIEDDNDDDPLVFEEPPEFDFGRQDYWDELYREEQQSPQGVSGVSETEGQDQESNGTVKSFSWYAGWDDLQPFVEELIPDKTSKTLIPGVGNDGALVGMYDSGFTELTAFDYAPQGVTCAEKLLDYRKEGVELLVADARDLPFNDNTYDAALDKGTLDAIYLSGGKDKDRARKHLEMANDELARVIRPGGVVISVSAACVDAVQASFETRPVLWKVLRDGSTYITEGE
mmetsp:Transcript_22445/g.34604  ORF Transcript_22445/g.34604 Transcript_22445/m.34604 type:complete len:305 (+) Transcript_22445:76-990(+)